MQDNPYAAPEPASEPSSAKPEHILGRLYSLIYSVLCILIGLVPIYGYYTHVARDVQYTVLILTFAWIATCGNSIVCFVLGILHIKTNFVTWMFWSTLSLLLFALAFLGFFGIGNAIKELWV